MSTFQGLAELRTPADLFQKLRHDLERLISRSGDQYAAFDFFVTAEHIVDWLHPTDRPARESLRNSNPLLRITSHLANGVKHFEATAKHHQSVADVEKQRYVQAGYVEEGYVAEPLIVHLTADEAKNLGVTNIEVEQLAQQVFVFWKTYLIKAGLVIAAASS